MKQKRLLRNKRARGKVRKSGSMITARDRENLSKRKGAFRMAGAKGKEKESTEVVKTDPSGQLSVPEFMRGAARQGVAQIGAEDVEMPRIKLIQAASTEFTDGKAKVGHYYHTILERDLGPVVPIIPIFIFRSFILWRPRWEGGGILARAMDGVNWNPPVGEFHIRPTKEAKTPVVWRLAPTVKESKLGDWGSSNPDDPQSQPAATRMINIVAWLRDHPEMSPAVFTLQRASFKVGRKLLGRINMSQAPVYGMVFNMDSVQEKNREGQDFLNPSISAAGYVTDKDLYESLEKMSKSFQKAGGVGIAGLEEMQAEAEVGPGESAIADSEQTEAVKARI